MQEPKHIRVETLTELQIWIEGQFALIIQAQRTAHDDLTNIRKTVHDLAGHIQVIQAHNFPERIKKLEEADQTQTRLIETFNKDLIARRATVALLRFVYVATGAVLGSLATAALELYKLAH